MSTASQSLVDCQLALSTEGTPRPIRTLSSSCPTLQSPLPRHLSPADTYMPAELQVRRSCLSRSPSGRSSSSASSSASCRSVRFDDAPAKVKFTYPKGVYDRASIVVDGALALKRCHREEETKKWADTLLLSNLQDADVHSLSMGDGWSSSDDESDDDDHRLYAAPQRATGAKLSPTMMDQASVRRGGPAELLPFLHVGSDTDDLTSDDDSSAATPASSPHSPMPHIVKNSEARISSSFPPVELPVFPGLFEKKERGRPVSVLPEPTFARWSNPTSTTVSTSARTSSPKRAHSQQDGRTQTRMRLLRKVEAEEEAYNCLNGF